MKGEVRRSQTAGRPSASEGFIVVRGARQHNLKSVDLAIPRNRLVVFTGVSGSGKSSLAFDTLHAEAHHRFVGSLSPFIRHFMGKVGRPKVDSVSGLNPSIAVEQRKLASNPRSTVGTFTEVLDHLRLLYSRIGQRHCLRCDSPIRPSSARQIARQLLAEVTLPTRVQVLALAVSRQRGTHRELLARGLEAGCVAAIVDGRRVGLDPPPRIDGRRKHDIEFVVAELRVARRSSRLRSELTAAVETGLALGGQRLHVRLDRGAKRSFSSAMLCPDCGRGVPPLTAQSFSFNSPTGMCPKCRGLGFQLEVAKDLLIHDPRLSILDGALTWFGNLRENQRTTWPLGPLDVIAAHYGVDLETPWKELPQAFRKVLLCGSGDEIVEFPPQSGIRNRRRPIKGLVAEIQRLYRETKSESTRKKYSAFMRNQSCPHCEGSRLNEEARAVTLAGQTISAVCAKSLDEALAWLRGLTADLDREPREIADESLAEIEQRLNAMIRLGLDYLTLDRPIPSLSGGECQRVRLAGQLSCGVVGVLYIFDEPSVGLHPRDLDQLLAALRQLCDQGNTVLLVEHDLATIRAADLVFDLGPGCGEAGGEIVAQGTPAEIEANAASCTGLYLSGRQRVGRGDRRAPPSAWLTVHGARLYNLRSLDARFPVGRLTCVTGVSGSGKSSLVSGTLVPALERELGVGNETPGPYERLGGSEAFSKVVCVTQEPIGRTPRSNPATYTKVFDAIRNFYASTPTARQEGLTASHFSFNSSAGQCATCRGFGRKRIEMHFLADVWVECQDCEGRRYNATMLDVRHRGRSIADVLDMSVAEAKALFAEERPIAKLLGILDDVGLGYLKLGQSATTLSGGEAQRVKLARELGGGGDGRTFYMLDEPTSGLHCEDIQNLLNILHRLVEAGNTVVVIEHNLDVVQAADWILDLGPEGGQRGGRIIAEGSPEEIIDVAESHTARHLRDRIAR